MHVKSKFNGSNRSRIDAPAVRPTPRHRFRTRPDRSEPQKIYFSERQKAAVGYGRYGLPIGGVLATENTVIPYECLFAREGRAPDLGRTRRGADGLQEHPRGDGCPEGPRDDL